MFLEKASFCEMFLRKEFFRSFPVTMISYILEVKPLWVVFYCLAAKRENNDSRRTFKQENLKN